MLVTGASSGLGKHFAMLLARAGAHVIVAARRADALAETVTAVTGEGGTCRAVCLDVTDAASIEANAEIFASLDVLVNNAGIVRQASLPDQTEQEWDTVLSTNLKGAFLLTRATAAAMKSRGRGGAIVNIASILGLRQVAGVSSYCASKAALVQFTKTSALELARHDIRVNALAPGYFATDLNADFFESMAGQAMIDRIPRRRLGRMEDLEGPLLLLASDASAYMTGTVIAVDGGHLVSGL